MCKMYCKSFPHTFLLTKAWYLWRKQSANGWFQCFSSIASKDTFVVSVLTQNRSFKEPFAMPHLSQNDSTSARHYLLCPSSTPDLVFSHQQKHVSRKSGAGLFSTGKKEALHIHHSFLCHCLSVLQTYITSSSGDYTVCSHVKVSLMLWNVIYYTLVQDQA